MSNRCFLFEPCHNLCIDDATEFGRVVTLFDETSWRTSLFDPELIDVIQQKLTDFNFNPESDYVVASGQFLAVVIFLMVASQFGDIRILAWNAKDREYELLGNQNETTT